VQPLRFLDILYLKTITVKTRGVKVKLPHPACFLLHKIIVFKRRPEKHKRIKEIEQIERMIDFLKKEDELYLLKKIFTELHTGWQKRIIDILRDLNKEELVEILQ